MANPVAITREAVLFPLLSVLGSAALMLIVLLGPA